MHPGRVFVGNRGDLGNRVEGSGMQIAGLQADNRGPGVIEEPSPHLFRADPALLVHRDHDGRAETEVAQRDQERFVPFGPNACRCFDPRRWSTNPRRVPPEACHP